MTYLALLIASCMTWLFGIIAAFEGRWERAFFFTWGAVVIFAVGLIVMWKEVEVDMVVDEDRPS